ncbi:DUF808 family protein [Pasteurella skyensis]|uniref:DUF808 family protein n=1 Tax=Phocoenobacter skyensis TaxID=97481 RepID=A0AAJ6N8V5_9PAST|nr:DUF808 family protein [Pasteurella skyensis]MDP8162311.1 DUF808 family protein [Pasteurella skyensis]MDP8172355.1 DUF808 family protein [Pasteurella skyensis]MDP8177013.1 DUF808 family protein [Pasteurella skyensis]MDP8178610.1 DUF808 family protein [Pasteurella skyensis]MDP8182612.1 DUF808 family protein [Pasteurella skyensis]
MAGLLGYLSLLADDIGSLASKAVATTTKTIATSFDDVALLFDDIVTYTKVASIKSTGLIVDDLAAIASMTNDTTSEILKKELSQVKSSQELKQHIEKLPENEKKEVLAELTNLRQKAIQKATENAAKREIPIIYKIAKGSFKNKFIIIPLVLLMSAFTPWLISPILIIGGIYLAYEGVESILAKLGLHHKKHNAQPQNLNLTSEKFEKKKIAGAIKTDFILSFEIIVITLGLVQESDFLIKLFVLILIGMLSTIVVYGIVGLIIKLDDIGFYLKKKKSQSSQSLGDILIKAMPVLIKGIGIIGTIAMLAVGGNIISHQTHLFASFNHTIENIPFSAFVLDILLALVVGYIAVKIVELGKSVLGNKNTQTNNTSDL